MVLTDIVGTVTSSNIYEAFGSVLSTSGFSENNRLANTKELDESIGVYNHGFRPYDPETGGYLLRDPLGTEEGPNAYSYVGSNVVNRIDPLGLKTVDEWSDQETELFDAMIERKHGGGEWTENDQNRLTSLMDALQRAEAGEGVVMEEGVYITESEWGQSLDTDTGIGDYFENFGEAHYDQAVATGEGLTEVIGAVADQGLEGVTLGETPGTAADVAKGHGTTAYVAVKGSVVVAVVAAATAGGLVVAEGLGGGGAEFERQVFIGPGEHGLKVTNAIAEGLARQGYSPSEIVKIITLISGSGPNGPPTLP